MCRAGGDDILLTVDNVDEYVELLPKVQCVYINVCMYMYTYVYIILVCMYMYTYICISCIYTCCIYIHTRVYTHTVYKYTLYTYTHIVNKYTYCIHRSCWSIQCGSSLRLSAAGSGACFSVSHCVSTCCFVR